jgi:regulator of protease activity HflC (stomatin/prohibitin superfamily)
MISLIILSVSILISLGIIYSTRDNAFTITQDKYGSTNKQLKISWLTKPILILVIGILTAAIQPFALERVDAGHVGLKVKLSGDNRGVSDYQYRTGWVVQNTWIEKLYEFPTFQQHIEYGDQTVITKGGFSAIIKPTFNYSLKPDAVGDMFEQLRLGVKEIEQGWLMTAIVGSVNDVANRWAVDDIFNKREEFESAIITECNKRTSKWFIISQLRTNIVPPDALKSAIEAKTKAVQDAQAAIQQALVADAQAKKKIAIARGDSAAVVINASGQAAASIITADGEAKAMKLKQAQLSQLYIDYIRATNWDGKYPQTMLGGNTSTLLNIK